MDGYEDPLKITESFFRLECVACDPACLQLQKTPDLGRWEFHMCGIKVGQYALTIQLKKIQELYYKSPGIPIIVK